MMPHNFQTSIYILGNQKDLLMEIKTMRVKGAQSRWGGPNYDLTEDGRSFYIQQNLAHLHF